MTYSYLEGFDIGIATVLLGIIMDTTISRKSLLKFWENDKNLFISCYKTVFLNILLMGPIIYKIAKEVIIKNDINNHFMMKEFVPLVIIHNIGYYALHYLMHKNPNFRKWHDYHHKFINPIFPTVGNAVSMEEFLFVYVLPFLVGAVIVNPNINNFRSSIGLISFLNLTIHCEELRDIKYPPFIVSPLDHTEHHHKNYGSKDTFAAPLIKIDSMLKLITNGKD